ncbi:hypothetical protein ACXOLC_07400, partial [Streptococcus thermophilus]
LKDSKTNIFKQGEVANFIIELSKSKLLCIEYRDFLEAIKILLYHLSVNLYSVIKSNRKAF